MRKETLIQWLEESNHSNEWLAEKCRVKVKTVSSWRSDRPIPAKAVLLIRNLMEADQAMEEVRDNPRQNLVLEFANQEFTDIENAAKKCGETTRDWSKKTLLSIAEMDLDHLVKEIIPLQKSKVNYRDAMEAPSLRVADEPAKEEANGTE
jgi:hypothetical protein